MIRKNERQSGIELLKIFAIFAVISFHILQTLTGLNTQLPNEEILNLSVATSDLQQFLLSFFKGLGMFGNGIFITASSWFLCSDNKTKWEKVIRILLDAWFISVGFLIIFLAFGVSVGRLDIVNCLMPTSLVVNWYVTAYLMVYAIHKYLNQIIDNMSKKSLLTFVLCLLLFFSIINSVFRDAFFCNELIRFIVFYFVVAYMKRYLTSFVDDVKKNIILLIVGVLGTVILVGITNIIGLMVPSLSVNITRWYFNSNIFNMLVVIALFNLFRNMNFKNKFINASSSLILFVYIIHENLLVRTYLRPQLLLWIYDKYGFEHIILMVVLLTILIFLCSYVLAFIYKNTIGRLTQMLSPKIIALLDKGYNKILQCK